MSDDFSNELQAITAIYGDDILQKLSTDEPHIYALSLKQHQVTLRLCFPPAYPATTAPELQGTESVGSTARKGHGSHVLATARRILDAIFVPGQVCLFDLIQALEEELVAPIKGGEYVGDATEEERKHGDESNLLVLTSTSSPSTLTGQTPTPSSKKPNLPPSSASTVPHPIPPTWILSTTITEKKSIFLARACTVTSPAHAQTCIAHLLATDRRAAKATHNITAYRIRDPSTTTTARGISGPTFQDCDDDGESAAGGRMLHLLQVMDAWGVLVVVSRWYGGVKLGPDRFRIINQVVREVVVRGGWEKGGVGG